MNTFVILLIGFVVGLFVAVLATVLGMRKLMVVPHRSHRSFEDTCRAIEEVIPGHKGWGFPIETWNFYETFLKKNLVPRGMRKLKVYFVCNAALASDVISDTPSMAGIMPCSWAVYEMDDGSVWLSKMNIALMSKMFGGVIRRAMTEVARMDEVFLRQVLSPADETGRARDDRSDDPEEPEEREEEAVA